MKREYDCVDCGKHTEYEDPDCLVNCELNRCFECFVKAYKKPLFIPKNSLSEDELRRMTDAIMSNNHQPYLPYNPLPKWIAGPPTTTGWHWLKFQEDVEVYYITGIDDYKCFVENKDCWAVGKDHILAHSPIQEPVDDN